MKKTILICTLASILAFSAGWVTNQKVTETIPVEEYNFLKEANDFKRELLDAQYRALEQGNKVMDNNELWDEDGSDDMMYYMDYMEVVDSLYESQL